MNIEVDNGRVQVFDPLKRDMEQSATCRICSRGDSNNFCTISVSFDSFIYFFAGQCLEMVQSGGPIEICSSRFSSTSAQVKSWP
jgi:hypothetical protein